MSEILLGLELQQRHRRPGDDWNRSAKRAAERWEQHFEELRSFGAKRGHINVPKCYKPNPALGQWCHNQRQRYRKMQEGKTSHITAARVAALEGIGFKWVLRPPWCKRLEELNAYKAEHGDVDVPRSYKANPVLARWVRTQREEYQKFQQGTPSQITAERVAALNNIGFVWRVEKYCQKATWEDRLEELRQYKAQHGHTDVPRSYQPNPSLAIWVSTQQKEYRKLKQGKPSYKMAERAEALDAIGFKWKM